MNWRTDHRVWKEREEETLQAFLRQERCEGDFPIISTGRTLLWDEELFAEHLNPHGTKPAVRFHWCGHNRKGMSRIIKLLMTELGEPPKKASLRASHRDRGIDSFVVGEINVSDLA